jgi:hypothetical protein
MYDLIDYKGKFTIIQDKNRIDKTWDYVVGEISHENALLEIPNRIDAADYYGVPVYIGKNKELNNLIDKLTKNVYGWKQYEDEE